MKIGQFERWAEVYDLIYSGYKDDIQFYAGAAKNSNGKVLEVACGTGRVYLELLKAGADVYGIDISENMLSTLKKKAAISMLKPKVAVADMRDFTLKKKFSLIIIPFRAFLHNLTTDDQLSTLKNCRKHLATKGKLMLNFFLPNPEYIAHNFGKEIRKLIDSAEGQLERATTSQFINTPEQIIEFKDAVTRESTTLWSDTFKIAFIYKREFELLLRLVGFSKWQVYGGFECEALSSYNQEMVWIVEK